MKYTKEFVDLFAKRELFSFRDVKMFLSQKGASEAYQRIFLNNFIKRGDVLQISKGKYSFFKQIDFVEKTILPSYHGLQDALSLHKIWGQQTIPILITPLKIRTGERKIAGGRVIVRRIKREMYFGYETIVQGDFWVTVSDIEKTLLDFAYFNEPIDAQTLKVLKKKVNKGKLLQYLFLAGPIVTKKFHNRFGFVA